MAHNERPGNETAADQSYLKELWDTFSKQFRKSWKGDSGFFGNPKKDFQDTFRAYLTDATSKREAQKQELKQIVFGLENVGLSSVIFFILPIVFLVKSIKGFKPGFLAGLKNLGIEFSRCVSIALEQSLLLIRGATQIAAYPLTLCLKMPFRLILTALAERKAYAPRKESTEESGERNTDLPPFSSMPPGYDTYQQRPQGRQGPMKHTRYDTDALEHNPTCTYSQW